MIDAPAAWWDLGQASLDPAAGPEASSRPPGGGFSCPLRLALGGSDATFPGEAAGILLTDRWFELLTGSSIGGSFLLLKPQPGR